ncbi:MAG: universal stress protein [Halosimplex sp.]
MTETILLSLDGSDAEGHDTGRTDAAIDRALELAGPGGVVHAHYVVDTGRYGEPALSSTEILIDDVEDAGNELLAAVDERGRERGVTVLTRCCHGRPHEELAAYAAEVGPDAIVLAGRPRPGRVRKDLERVTDRVVAPRAVVGR